DHHRARFPRGDSALGPPVRPPLLAPPPGKTLSSVLLSAVGTNVKVGLLVIAGILAFVAIYSFLQDRQGGGQANEYWALFTDASGLSVRAEVRVAGVQVGEVSSIELQGGRARVHFTVRPDV